MPNKVSVLLSLPTMTLERNTPRKDDPARGQDAQVLAALGYYRALASLGVPPNVRHMDDYEWESPETGRVAILPDVRALSATQIARMQSFVAHGNTLLLSGLSGFYDTNAGAWSVPMQDRAEQPLAAVTGARLKEVFLMPGKPELRMEGHGAALPFRLWKSSLEIVPGSGARPLSTIGGEVYATNRTLPGGGRVLWLPALVETEAWFTDGAALSTFLHEEHMDDASLPFHFRTRSTCILRTLESGSEYLTVVANGSAEPVACTLSAPDGLRGVSLEGSTGSAALAPLETRVTLWQRR